MIRRIKGWFNWQLTKLAFNAQSRHLEGVRRGDVSPCDHPKCPCVKSKRNENHFA